MPGDAVYGFAFIAIAAWIGLFYVVIYRKNGSLRTSRPRQYFRTPFRPNKALGSDLMDPGRQLNAVMGASFATRKLLSSAEYKVFKIVEDDIAVARRGYRVFAQTSLGEILRSPDQEAFHSINSKRVDILIVDPTGWPKVAVEYQGSGHYQGTAAARDAVKKEALRKAGVGYLEFSDSDSPAQIRSRVRQQLGWETAAP